MQDITDRTYKTQSPEPLAREKGGVKQWRQIAHIRLKRTIAYALQRLFREAAPLVYSPKIAAEEGLDSLLSIFDVVAPEESADMRRQIIGKGDERRLKFNREGNIHDGDRRRGAQENLAA